VHLPVRGYPLKQGGKSSCLNLKRNNTAFYDPLTKLALPPVTNPQCILENREKKTAAEN